MSQRLSIFEFNDRDRPRGRTREEINYLSAAAGLSVSADNCQNWPLQRLIVWNRACRRRRRDIPGQIGRERIERIRSPRSLSQSVGPKLHSVATPAVWRDHDVRIGGGWLVAGAGNLEGSASESRQDIGDCYSSNLDKFLGEWPNGAPQGRHARNYRRRLVDLDRDRTRAGQAGAVGRRARQCGTRRVTAKHGRSATRGRVYARLGITDIPTDCHIASVPTVIAQRAVDLRNNDGRCCVY